MRATRLIGLAIATMLVATTAVPANARTPVDPTTLTPPLRPFRVCWELGPYVQCDTSGTTSFENEPYDVLPCGQLYTTGTDIANSTRWYKNGLIVRRAVQERDRGTWSLSPSGEGPSVEWKIDSSWDEHFAVPGDIDSAIRDVRGITLNVPAVGPSLKEAGLYLGADDITHGLSTGGDTEGIAKLCELLVG